MRSDNGPLVGSTGSGRITKLLSVGLKSLFILICLISITFKQFIFIVKILQQRLFMNSLYSLPQEMILQIFQYLPIKDLIRAGETCKKLNEVSKTARSLIPNLDATIVQENALTLWTGLYRGYFNNKWIPSRNFKVDSEGKLTSIRSYNLTTKVQKWWNDKQNDKKTTRKVNEIIKITLQEIYKLNVRGKLPKEVEPSEVCLPRSSLIKETKRYIYVWNLKKQHSSYFPAVNLAEIILKSKQFSTLEISKAATLVKEQENLYPNRCKSMEKPGLNGSEEDIALFIKTL